MSMIFNGTNGLQFPDGSAQAESMTDYGIGDVKSLAEGYNIDTLFANGRYSVTRPTITGGGNFSTIGTYTIDVMKSSDGACIQLICRNGSLEFKFRRYDTISWYTGSIWNALNDGNGGQPPAPKPIYGVVSNLTNGASQQIFTPATGVLYRMTVMRQAGAAANQGIDVVILKASSAIDWNVLYYSGVGLYINGTIGVGITNNGGATLSYTYSVQQLSW